MPSSIVAGRSVFSRSNQTGHAQNRGLFLNPAGIGQNQPGLIREPQEIQIAERRIGDQPRLACAIASLAQITLQAEFFDALCRMRGSIGNKIGRLFAISEMAFSRGFKDSALSTFDGRCRVSTP